MKPAYAPLIFGARKISPLIAAVVFPAAVFLGALLLTESLPAALWACCACAACITVALTGSLARDEWLKRKAGRGPDERTCAKPEALDLTDAERLLLDASFLAIIALNHTEDEIDALQDWSERARALENGGER